MLLPSENRYHSDPVQFREGAPPYPYGRAVKSASVQNREPVERANKQIDDCWAWYVSNMIPDLKGLLLSIVIN